MKIRYVQVAIPKPVEGLFHYLVPDHLASLIRPGVRVRVPFGRQTLEGFVISHSVPPPLDKIKEILEVTDPEPEITPDLLALSEWISSYYQAPPGMVLKVLSPVRAMKAKTRPFYKLSMSLLEAEETVNRLSRAPRQAEVLARFISEKTVQWNEEWGNPAALKELVRKGILEEVREEVFRSPYQVSAESPVEKPSLTDEQSAVFQEVEKALNIGSFQPFLLYGITGSGKTEIYLRAMEHVLNRGGEGMILVPEISLTSQIVRLILERFGKKVALIHSGLSAGERSDAWKKVRSGDISIVVGVRSALFAPFARLKLIIIDEEHDGAYKQENDVRYHARDTALVRGKQAGAVVLLGSATPSLESYFNSQNGKSKLLLLTRRVGHRPIPHVHLINLTESPPVLKEGGISEPLCRALRECLSRKEQAVLFLNRRGFSPFLLCYDCGFSLKCPHCTVALTYHKNKDRFLCHYCNFLAPPPADCPSCKGNKLAYLGTGTEKIEEELGALFPEARIKRMDRDTTSRKFAHDDILADMRERKIDILLGTQMVTKGHDHPGVTLVGVLCADTILNFPDFRAAEKTFQTLTQVAGRAGRGDSPGEVYIQTYNPDHYSIAYASNQDYPGFYEREILFRKELNYPPYSRLASLLISGSREKPVEEKARAVGKLLHSIKNPRFDCLGPAPASLYRIKGKFRWRCLLRGKETKAVLDAVRLVQKQWKEMKGSGISLEVDVDPQNLL